MSRSTGDTDILTGLLWMAKEFMSRIMSNMCRICIFFVKNVVELTEKRRILFCHSMGGAIGVRYLEEFPLTFDAAILSAPMLGMNTGKYPEVACESYRRFFLRDRKGNEICCRTEWFSDKPSFETSSCVPENDTCISTICVCGISITRLTVEPMLGKSRI